MLGDIVKRLRASVGCDAINGDAMERSVCASQMQEAADEIERLHTKYEQANMVQEWDGEAIESYKAEIERLRGERDKARNDLATLLAHDELQGQTNIDDKATLRTNLSAAAAECVAWLEWKTMIVEAVHRELRRTPHIMLSTPEEDAVTHRLTLARMHTEELGGPGAWCKEGE